jgi:hypothetical protein
MKRVGLRRGARALVLVASIVGVLTAGIATQASATSPPGPTVAGTNFKQANPNNTISAELTAGAGIGDVVVVSVATGTFAGDVGCTDSEGNFYSVAADKNTGSGRLFVCVARPTNPLVAGDEVTATYPGFSGLSVIRVVVFHGAFGFADASSTGSGSNPPVSTGTICVSGGHWLFGVVANGNISSFVVDTPPWIPLGSNSGGSGAGKRTLTTAYRWVYQSCPPSGPYALTGHLTGSGFWQAAIVGLPGGGI